MDDPKDPKTVSASASGADSAKKKDKKGGHSHEEQENKFVQWFKAKRTEYWAEFKRIVWLSREDLLRQTLTVIVISLLFGVYITILDGGLSFLFTQAATRLTALF